MGEVSPGLDRVPSEVLRAHQEALLADQVARLYERSSYYQRLFDRLGVSPAGLRTLNDLARQVPPITKSEILDDQRESPPFGSLFAAEVSALARLYVQPGPELIAWTPNDERAMVRMFAAGLATCGVRPDDVVDLTFQFNWVMAGTVWDRAVRELGATALAGGAGMKQTHAGMLRQLGVSVLAGFPTFLADIGRTARELGLDPAVDTRVRLLVIAGEVPSPLMRAELARTFGADVRESYGTSEIGLVASECEAGAGMHLHPLVAVEVVDPESGAPVSDGEPGELILTDLLGKEALPLLRYRTHDIAEGLWRETCRCGRTTPRLGRIVGRIGQVARVKGLFVFPRQFAAVVSQYPELGRFQIVVDRPVVGDRLLLRVECTRPSSELAERLCDQIRSTMHMRPEIELVSPGGIDAAEPLLLDRRSAEPGRG